VVFSAVAACTWADAEPYPTTGRRAISLPASAVRVEPGKTVEHIFTARGEVLWLSVEVKGPGYLIYTGSARNARADVAAFDAKALPVGGGNWQWAGWKQFFPAVVAPGVHYLRLTCTAPDRAPMSITLSTAPMDPGEPDDTRLPDGGQAPDRARGVKPGRPVEIRILPAGDVDRLRFQVGQAGYAVFTQVGGRGAPVRLQYSLLDSAGTVVADTSKNLPIQSGRSDLWSALRVDPGRYTLAVRAGKAFPDMVQFRVDVMQEVDAYEPNDRREAARPVPLDSVLPIYILPAGDVDWLRISVPGLPRRRPGEPGDGTLTCRQIGGGDAAGRFRFQLWDAAGEREYQLPRSRLDGEDARTATRVSGGDYLLRVSGRPSLTPLKLRLTFEADAATSAPVERPEATRPAEPPPETAQPAREREHISPAWLWALAAAAGLIIVPLLLLAAIWIARSRRWRRR